MMARVSKLSKQAKAVIAAGAALVILGGILAVLLLTKPHSNLASDDPASAVTELGGSNAYIVDRSADEVMSVKIENESGAFTFTRQTRVINSVNESGEPIRYDEFYWTSDDLKGVPQSDSSVRNFIADLACLPEKSAVEDNAEDLEKYGLEKPVSIAVLRFDDGTTLEMRFGIINPADDSGVYFTLNDSRDVKLVNYYAISEVFSSVKQFARLALTESGETLQKLTITRPDLDFPLEICAAADSDSAYRFISPINAELDPEKGKGICKGLCGLTMDSCEFPEQTNENMERCGLLQPRAVVTFSCGGIERELLIGNEIRQDLTSDNASRPPVSTVTGYYAAVKGVPGIYSLARENAPWVGVNVGDLVSRKPLSLYIFAVSSVEIRLPDGEFTFINENETFTYNGSPLPSESFREFFNTLTAEFDGEAFAGEISGKPCAEVTFSYKTDEYGTESDTLSFYELDERRCAVVLDGTPLFAVSKVRAERIAADTAALVGG